MFYLWWILLILFKCKAVDTVVMIDPDDPMNAHFPKIRSNKIALSPLSDSKSNQLAELLINPSAKIQANPKGKEFSLRCEGQAGDSGRFTDLKWFGPKGELAEGRSGSLEVYKEGNKLHLMFREPSADDSGMYNCTAVHYTIEKMNTGVQLIFYHDITWDDCPTEQILMTNRDNKIRCKISANPPAVLSWRKDGQALPDRYVIEYDGIKIPDVNKKDKGIFSVSAMVQQTGSFQSRTIKVEIHDSNQAESLEIENQSAGNDCDLTYVLILGCIILQMELINYMLVYH